MKLSELEMDEWDGTWEVVFETDEKKILLLHLANMVGLKEAGRRNLICVDPSNNIVWIAEAPKTGRSIGWYKDDFNIQNNKLIGSYGGSVFVEIDPSNGLILEEKFKPW